MGGVRVLVALSVRCQNERSLSLVDEYSYAAHVPLLSLPPRHGARKHSSRISHSPSHPGQCCWCRRIKVRAASSASFRELASRDRKSTRLNSSHTVISYAVFCLKKKKESNYHTRHNRHREP